MIRYYAIVAISLIYSHSTNAEAWFQNDIEQIKSDLSDEKPSIIGRIFSSEPVDILCNVLINNQKESVCNEVRRYLVYEDRGNAFMSFVERHELPATRPREFPGAEDAYKCEDIDIENLNMKKRMYWCDAKLFRQPQSVFFGVMEGFYCAGSRNKPARVFAFRPPTEDSLEVRPVGELNDVHLLQLCAGIADPE